MIKAALLLFVFALVVAGLGGLAYAVAPPESSAITAVLVTGAAAAVAITCAVLCVLGAAGPGADGKPNKLGMIGVHVGLALPLLLTLAVAGRAVPGTTALLEARQRLTADGDTLAAVAGAVLNSEQAQKDLRAVEKDYLTMTLWGLAGVSVMTFAGLLLLRPKPRAAA